MDPYVNTHFAPRKTGVVQQPVLQKNAGNSKGKKTTAGKVLGRSAEELKVQLQNALQKKKELKMQLTQSSEEVSRIEGAIEQLKQESESKSSENRTLKEEVDALQQLKDSLASQNSNLESEMNHLRSLLAAKEEHSRLMQQENETLSHALQSLKSDLESMGPNDSAEIERAEATRDTDPEVQAKIDAIQAQHDREMEKLADSMREQTQKLRQIKAQELEQELKVRAVEEERALQSVRQIAMKNGMSNMLKLCTNGKTHPVRLWIEDGSVCWLKAEGVGKKEKRIAVSDIKEIWFGQDAGLFQSGKFGTAERGKFSESCCFSILTGDRSLDICTPAEEACDIWVMGLGKLCGKRPISQNASIL
jgi:hypothetical protein